jgi:hypothetical protein
MLLVHCVCFLDVRIIRKPMKRKSGVILFQSHLKAALGVCNPVLTDPSPREEFLLDGTNKL